MNPFRAMAMVPTLTGYESGANPTTVRIQKEHPILFSGPMVKAILEGRKVQTRRVLKIQPSSDHEIKYADHDIPEWKCPYGEKGDRLWVKETFQHVGNLLAISPKYCRYRADGEEQPVGPWKPSIFMPRWDSRIMLEITGVRVERLQDIDPRDCIDEGIDFKKHECGCETCAQSSKLCPATGSSLIMEYSELWDSINRKSHPWSSNPWVWVITFKRIIENS